MSKSWTITETDLMILPYSLGGIILFAILFWAGRNLLNKLFDWNL